MAKSVVEHLKERYDLNLPLWAARQSRNNFFPNWKKSLKYAATAQAVFFVFFLLFHTVCMNCILLIHVFSWSPQMESAPLVTSWRQTDGTTYFSPWQVELLTSKRSVPNSSVWLDEQSSLLSLIFHLNLLRVQPQLSALTHSCGKMLPVDSGLHLVIFTTFFSPPCEAYLHTYTHTYTSQTAWVTAFFPAQNDLSCLIFFKFFFKVQ